MLESGRILQSRYEIIEPIGTGGMSDVYKAKDHSLNRDVAIKVLKEEFAQDVSFVTKFRAEAQAAAGLEHPNIVNIYDVGSEDGLYYIVMEYVEGITLKTYISKKGALGYNELLSIMIQVGRGIEAAHNKNIIHRDIKPQNIIISREGKVKVTDFGIAKAVTSNTINADRMGSVHYASPEQTRNEQVTFQSDVYSFGIVMYEACTGQLPYDGDTAVAVAIQHLQTEITPPSAIVADVPISVEKIILRATLKSPERRYDTMTDLLTDLKKALQNPYDDFVYIPPLESEMPQEMVKEVVTIPSDKEITTESLKNILHPKKDDDDDIDDDIDDDDDDDDDDDSEVNKKMDKAIAILGIAAAVVILIVVVYIAGSFLGLFRFGPMGRDAETEQGEMVEVPSVLGKSEDEAKKILEEAGFECKVVGESSSDEYEEGDVMLQDPKAGEEAETGSTVNITLSSGEGEIDIPNVVGQTEENAIKQLEAAGFSYRKNYQKHETVPQGQVISQVPEGSQKGKEGDIVTLTISQGVGTVRVPDVNNKAQAQATQELQAAGLRVGNVTQENSDTVAPGNVIRQSLAANSVADAGSTVDLVISQGPATVYYKLSAKEIYPIDGNPTYVELKDGNNKTVWSETIKGGKSISASNLSTPSGTITYYSEDRSQVLKTEQVSFEKQ